MNKQNFRPRELPKEGECASHGLATWVFFQCGDKAKYAGPDLNGDGHLGAFVGSILKKFRFTPRLGCQRRTDLGEQESR